MLTKSPSKLILTWSTLVFNLCRTPVAAICQWQSEDLDLLIEVLQHKKASQSNTIIIMLPSALFLFSLLLCTSAVNSQSSPPPSEPILLDCGSTSSSSESEDAWHADSNSRFRYSTSANSSETSATEQDPTIPSHIPYMTARISLYKLTYAFPISPGPKFIRLYFYPATYKSTSTSTTFNTSNSFFTVNANNFTLLKNFSASLHLLDSIPELRVAFLIKEFIVTVQENQTLNITFTSSTKSLVFINGIEIVPIPDNLYIKDMDYPYKLLNYNNLFYFDKPTALETIYRLNVGGGRANDTELFRTWSDDTDYIDGVPGFVHKSLDTPIKYTDITPNYTAPEVVYRTKRTMGPDPKVNLGYNLTWKFPVDSGFYYLVRLHFCETEKYVNNTHQRVFFIFINNMTAEEAFDPFDHTKGNDIPVYQDYIVNVPEGSQRKPKLSLALHPTSDVIFADALLNGLEIFKLNKSNGDLSGLNPVLPTPLEQPSPSRDKTRSQSRILPIIGAVLGGVFILSLVIFFFVYRPKAKGKDTRTAHHKSIWYPFSYTSTSTATSALLLPTDLCRQFTVLEIRTATRNFHDENVVGSGGFGTVYKGFIENGSIPVAIKRLDSSSKQGIREFHTEIEMLSKLRHAHLVSLIGYCDDEDEMILVYEFMDQGNLQDHMYKAKKISLPWKLRLQICIGAAKGLHYLHTGAKHTIIHRDVKSSNILLNSNWVAKVSDFGLSKAGPTSESQTHVSTFVRGSFGYLDPEYYRRQQLTEKSDVYSFGVVLLEVVHARPPIVSTETKEQVNLVEWARKCYKKGTINQNIDPQLKGDIATVSLNKFMEIAESCVREKSTERPTMGDVVWGLEFALQLQETTEKNVDDGDDVNDDTQKSSFPAYRRVINTDDENLFASSSAPTLGSRATLSISESSISNNDFDGARPENVFSEIMNQEGR